MSKIQEQLENVQNKIATLEETRRNMERNLQNLQEELIINQADLIKLRRHENLLLGKLEKDCK